MLADPFGNRLVAGDSPNPKRRGRVEFLVEICDPCEAPSFGYTVNGVRVSDFYTPRYFEPSQPSATGSVSRYDFMGHITAPHQVLRAGYLSWREPSGEWFQELYFGKAPQFKSIGHLDKSFGSLRSWIDSLTLEQRREALKQRAAYPEQVLVKLPDEDDDNDLVGEATKRRADLLRTQIAQVRSGTKRSPHK
jgi:hypothetical protein